MSKRNFLKPVEALLAALLAVGAPVMASATSVDSKVVSQVAIEQPTAVQAKGPLLVKPSKKLGKQTSHYSHSSHSSHASHASHASHYSSSY